MNNVNEPLKLSITLRPPIVKDLIFIQKHISDEVGGERVTRTFAISKSIRKYREMIEKEKENEELC